MSEQPIQYEIKRRFLTISNQWEELKQHKTRLFIKQAYPDSLQGADVVGRVRCTEDHKMKVTFTGCKKGLPDGLKTPEEEGPISESEFDTGLLLAGNKILTKYRWPIRGGGHVLQVEQFLDIRHKPSSLVITEVEFDGPDALKQANTFTPPDWLGEEITGQSHWSNYSLCIIGEPQNWCK